jgi:hypothetical protein
VVAGKIHQSRLLPLRNHGKKIAESVKKLGVLQPLIVRPLTGCTGEFEIIDGSGRLDSLQADQMVEVAILEEASDDDVFKISIATFKRQGQTALDKAKFCKAWLDVIIKQNGSSAGAQLQLVRSLGVSESLISKYLAIHQLFEILEKSNPNSNFSALKLWDMNRLYQLSKLQLNSRLLAIATELEKRPKTLLEDLKLIIAKAQAEELKPNQITENAQLTAKEMLAILPSDNASDCQSEPKISQITVPETTLEKLTNLADKTTTDLNAINTKLHSVMSQIKDHTEKYATSDVVAAIEHVLKLLKKLQSYADSLSKQAPSKEDIAPTTLPNEKDK